MEKIFNLPLIFKETKIGFLGLLIAIGSLTTIVLHAQSSDGVLGIGTSGTEGLVKYSVTQGGLLVVLIIGLWFYRRDYSNIFSRQGETIQVLTRALMDSTQAITNSHAAIESLDKNVDRLVSSTDQLRVTMVDAITNNRRTRER